MFNVLSDIRNFSFVNLRQVQTRVLTSDGRQLVESRDRSGRIIAKETGKIVDAFVEDLEPDLEVGEVLPGLLLGSQDVAHDMDILQKNYVTHILNLATGVPNTFEDQFEYKTINMLDLPETNIRDYFEECFEFIEDARLNQGTVLVHCNAGISRSAAIVIAYVMKSQGRRYGQAYDMVKAKRSIKPNEGFVRQLESYDTELFSRRQPPNKAKAAQKQQAPPQKPPPQPATITTSTTTKSPTTKTSTLTTQLKTPSPAAAPPPPPPPPPIKPTEQEDDDEEYTEEEYTDSEEEETPNPPPKKR